jgi:DNA-binding response OmpR family regulator
MRRTKCKSLIHGPLTFADYNEPVKPTVFVVEDDADIAALVEHHLHSAGYEPRVFADTHGVIKQAESRVPALFLLDIMLPGTSGLDVCSAIRRNPRLASIPIIFLTARGSEADRIAGLESGADDYITKPFSPKELVARVRAVLRRSQSSSSEVISAGPLCIDAARMTVTLHGKAIVTTATEFRLLELMAKSPGRVFTRDLLLDSVWGTGTFVTARSIDVYIRRLREKIEQDPDEPLMLRTVRGAGYKFEAGR